MLAIERPDGGVAHESHGEQRVGNTLGAQDRAQVRAGFDAIERGEFETYDESTTKGLAEEIKRRGRKRLAQANKKTGTRSK